jgi:tetratricopeptide (TPR) repeat protein
MKRNYLLLFIFIGQFLTAQNFQSVEEVNDACSQLGFMGNEEAELTVDRILDEIGVFRNFVLQECPDINNAVAKNIQTSGGEKVRYILYDNDFFNRIDQKASNDWASISILAHEIAHHLNGHALNNKGSNHRFELEADFSSGFYLAKMGASLEEAQSAINTLRYEKATSTHPAKKDRLNEIEKGWRKAYKIIKTVIVNDIPVVVDDEIEEDIIESIEVYDYDGDKIIANSELGNEAYQNKNYSAAADYFLKAYQYGAENYILYFSASAAVNAKNYNDALKKYLKLLDIGYTGVETNYYATLKKTGKEISYSSKAEMDFAVKKRKAINPRIETTKSRVPEIVKNISFIYVNKKEYTKALKYLDDAKKYDIDKYDLIVSEGNIYYGMGNKVRFREKLEEALKLRPNEPDLYFNLGVLYAEVDNSYKARLYYGKAIEVDPNYLNAYINIGALILNEENYIIEKMNNLGISEEENKEYDRLKEKRMDIYKEAVPYLEKAYSLGSNDAKATLNNIYEALGLSKRID